MKQRITKFTPRNDTIFKAIFADERNEHILMSFLRAVFEKSPLKIDISNLMVMNPNLPPDNLGERDSAVDILAVTETGEKINVEIQINDCHDIEKRTVFYGSRLITGQVRKDGIKRDRYKDIKNVIVIAIVDFKIIKDDDNYFHVNAMSDIINHRLYTDVMQIYTLELPKIPPEDDSHAIWTWLKFLDSDSVKEMQPLKNKISEVDQAMQIFEKYIDESEYRSMVETNEIKAQMHDNEIFFEGKEEGLKEGKEEGLKEGEAKGRIGAVVDLVLAENMPLEKAMKILKVDPALEPEIRKLLEK